MQMLPETMIPNDCLDFHKVFYLFYNIGCTLPKKLIQIIYITTTIVH